MHSRSVASVFRRSVVMTLGIAAVCASMAVQGKNQDAYPPAFSRPPTHGNGNQGGRPPYGSVNDLVGARASLVNGTMRQRGFSRTASSRNGANTYTHWKNARTRQCVEVVTAHNEVLGVNDLGRGACR